ncbi:MAG: DUF2807 domain-containing protein [Prolixibacteraceae bacterium]|jgi:hypothetical protein|nr:DUF2807 domain-containing protein [Prolixibacteraceae bacterium]
MKYAKISSLLLLLGIFIASLFSSCTSNIKRSNDNFYEKDYNIDNFKKIKLEGAYNIELTQGNESSLIMETSDEFHNKVRIWVSDDILHVKTNVKNIGTDEIKLFITVTKLESIKIEGGAYLQTVGFIELNNFDIEIEGGAHVDMQLTANTIKAKAEGAVNMQFEGVAEKFIAVSEGAGNIDADGLKAKYVECRVSGVGNASVYATEELNARVEGLGKISYRGNPTLYKQIEGIGFIYKK